MTRHRHSQDPTVLVFELRMPKGTSASRRREIARGLRRVTRASGLQIVTCKRLVLVSSTSHRAAGLDLDRITPWILRHAQGAELEFCHPMPLGELMRQEPIPSAVLTRYGRDACEQVQQRLQHMAMGLLFLMQVDHARQEIC